MLFLIPFFWAGSLCATVSHFLKDPSDPQFMRSNEFQLRMRFDHFEDSNSKNNHLLMILTNRAREVPYWNQAGAITRVLINQDILEANERTLIEQSIKSQAGMAVKPEDVTNALNAVANGDHALIESAKKLIENVSPGSFGIWTLDNLERYANANPTDQAARAEYLRRKTSSKESPPPASQVVDLYTQCPPENIPTELHYQILNNYDLLHEGEKKAIFQKILETKPFLVSFSTWHQSLVRALCRRANPSGPVAYSCFLISAKVNDLRLAFMNLGRAISMDFTGQTMNQPLNITVLSKVCQGSRHGKIEGINQYLAGYSLNLLAGHESGYLSDLTTEHIAAIFSRIFSFDDTKFVYLLAEANTPPSSKIRRALVESLAMKILRYLGLGALGILPLYQWQLFTPDHKYFLSTRSNLIEASNRWMVENNLKDLALAHITDPVLRWKFQFEVIRQAGINAAARIEALRDLWNAAPLPKPKGRIVADDPSKMNKFVYDLSWFEEPDGSIYYYNIMRRLEDIKGLMDDLHKSTVEPSWAERWTDFFLRGIAEFYGKNEERLLRRYWSSLKTIPEEEWPSYESYLRTLNRKRRSTHFFLNDDPVHGHSSYSLFYKSLKMGNCKLAELLAEHWPATDISPFVNQCMLVYKLKRPLSAKEFSEQGLQLFQSLMSKDFEVVDAFRLPVAVGQLRSLIEMYPEDKKKTSLVSALDSFPYERADWPYLIEAVKTTPSPLRKTFSDAIYQRMSSKPPLESHINAIRGFLKLSETNSTEFKNNVANVTKNFHKRLSNLADTSIDDARYHLGKGLKKAQMFGEDNAQALVKSIAPYLLQNAANPIHALHLNGTEIVTVMKPLASNASRKNWDDFLAVVTDPADRMQAFDNLKTSADWKNVAAGLGFDGLEWILIDGHGLKVENLQPFCAYASSHDFAAVDGVSSCNMESPRAKAARLVSLATKSRELPECNSVLFEAFTDIVKDCKYGEHETKTLLVFQEQIKYLIPHWPKTATRVLDGATYKLLKDPDAAPSNDSNEKTILGLLKSALTSDIDPPSTIHQMFEKTLKDHLEKELLPRSAEPEVYEILGVARKYNDAIEVLILEYLSSNFPGKMTKIINKFLSEAAATELLDLLTLEDFKHGLSEKEILAKLRTVSLRFLRRRGQVLPP